MSEARKGKKKKQKKNVKLLVYNIQNDTKEKTLTQRQKQNNKIIERNPVSVGMKGRQNKAYYQQIKDQIKLLGRFHKNLPSNFI